MGAEKEKGKDTGAGAIAPQIPFINVSKRTPGTDANIRKAVFFSIMKIFSSEDKNEHFLFAHALPIGHFEHPWWGEFDHTFEQLTAMKNAAELWQVRGGLMALNFDHDPSRPAGEIIKLEMQSSGLWALAKLTPNAYGKVKSGEYKRFSAEWISKFKDEKGEKYGEMFYGGALTNIPFFSVSLEGLFLLEDEELLKVAARKYEPQKTKEQENEMDAEKLKELTGEENPEKQLEIINGWKSDSEAGKKPEADAANEPKEPANQEPVEEDEKKVASDKYEKRIAALEKDLADVNISHNKQLKESEKKERQELIELGYRAGKITKDQKTKWADAEKCISFPTNESLGNFIKIDAAKVIPEPKGFEGSDVEKAPMSDEDKKSADRLNMSGEDYQRLSEGNIKKRTEDKK